MGTVFDRGTTLARGDLDIFLTDGSGNPTSAYTIAYAVFYVDPVSGAEVLIGAEVREPVNPDVGEYYAALMVPSNAQAGCYRIRWKFRETASSPEEGAVQEFGVKGDTQDSVTGVYSANVQNLITKMRFMTKDRNPDKTYHFRPPEGESKVSCYNQVFGFIWEDEEFAQFLEIALWKWNTMPPNTDKYRTLDMVCQQKTGWQAALLWGAIANAMNALVTSWVADEFDYSIGGISLTIDKSSKYSELRQNADEQFDKLVEAKSRTEKYVRGLAQSKYGRGVRASLGPNVGSGILSPRNYV